jgi:hypothetical protein
MGRWVGRWLPVVAVLVVFPLLPAMASNGKPCDRPSLNQAIEQLLANQQRADAQQTLKRCGNAAVQPLAAALSADATTRLYAAETLGQIGWEAKSAVADLVLVSQGDRDLAVRSKAVLALSAIGRDGTVHSQQLKGWQTGDIQDLQNLLQQLNSVFAALEQDQSDWTTKADDLETLRLTRNALQTQLRSLTAQPTYQALSWGQNHPWIVLIGVGAIALTTAYGTVFWLRPLWLLKLGDEAIEAIANIPKVGTALSGVLKTLVPLKYHPHVLDAWVEQHWKDVKEGFLQLDTVKDRRIFTPLPVHLNGKQIIKLRGSDLGETFDRKPAVLLIAGEGGAGKTSLTCQIALWGLEKSLVTHPAAHRLLPVLIETELDDKKTLLEAIGGQLKALINQQDDIPPGLLQKLLQHQRILVIVDHLSEMSETTRKQVTPELAGFPAKALIVTSRLEESLGKVPKTVLKPLQIEANCLWPFMSDYLKLIHKQDLFVDDEYSDACDRLRRIAGERSITVLLARLILTT